MANDNNLQHELDRYMTAKFQAEDAEIEIRNSSIEDLVNETVNKYNEDNDPDFEILDFINNNDLINSSLINRELSNIDSEATESGIYKIASTWTEEYENEKILNRETLAFINTVFNGYKRQKKDNTTKIFFKNPKRLKFIIYTSFSVAVSVILLFAIYFSSENTIDPKEIFSEYYEPYNYIGTEIRSSEFDQSSLLTEASELYAEGKFNLAASKYKTYTDIENNYVQPYFYLGISQIETQQYSEAISTFNEIIIKFDEFEIESKWYTALCYIMLDKNEKAKNYLQEISKINCIYQKDAKKILEKIL